MGDTALPGKTGTGVSSGDGGRLLRDIDPQRQASIEINSDSKNPEAPSQHSSSGPSSLSVSIEDDKGNVIMVSSMEDSGSVSTSTRDLEVTEGSDRVVITWHGRQGVKGFILHRSEKGKDNYTPISNLIPYFGRDDKDVFLYRFTDNSVKSGAKYDYRLEIVDPNYKTSLKLGKLTD